MTLAAPKRALKLLLRLAVVSSVPLFVLKGCAEKGDFGRPKETALSRFLTPLDGPTNSSFHYTDDEQELRDRAWRFLMPAKQRWFFDRLVYDAARSGYLPPDYFPETLSWYYDALKGEAFRSPASRYAQLSNDVSADRQLLGVFAHIASKVMRADSSRSRAIPNVSDLSVEEWNDARIRMQENRALIGWVCYRAAMRLQSYRYALEHGYVAMPQMEAVRAERALLAYERDFEPLRAGSCIRRDPWRDLQIHRGIRIPPDGHFYFDDEAGGPAAAPPAMRKPFRGVRKD